MADHFKEALEDFEAMIPDLEDQGASPLAIVEKLYTRFTAGLWIPQARDSGANPPLSEKTDGLPIAKPLATQPPESNQPEPEDTAETRNRAPNFNPIDTTSIPFPTTSSSKRTLQYLDQQVSTTTSSPSNKRPRIDSPQQTEQNLRPQDPQPTSQTPQQTVQTRTQPTQTPRSTQAPAPQTLTTPQPARFKRARSLRPLKPSELYTSPVVKVFLFDPEEKDEEIELQPASEPTTNSVDSDQPGTSPSKPFFLSRMAIQRASEYLWRSFRKMDELPAIEESDVKIKKEELDQEGAQSKRREPGAIYIPSKYIPSTEAFEAFIELAYNGRNYSCPYGTDQYDKIALFHARVYNVACCLQSEALQRKACEGLYRALKKNKLSVVATAKVARDLYGKAQAPDGKTQMDMRTSQTGIS